MVDGGPCDPRALMALFPAEGLPKVDLVRPFRFFYFCLFVDWGDYGAVLSRYCGELFCYSMLCKGTELKSQGYA